MTKSSTKILALLMLILSTMIVISSENWMGMWMGMEINMVSFITMIKENKNFSSPEAKMMYFLIQSMSSMIFIFSIVMMPVIMINEMSSTKEIMIILTSSMMMKLGIAPMHMWFVNIMSKISWNNCMILMTWQKIAPMWVISNLNQNMEMICLCSMMSAIMGAMGGINQTSVKKIMAFSSVNHLGWIMMCMKYHNEMWIKYLIIYSIIIIMIAKLMEKNSINFISQINLNMKSNLSKINLMIMMLSLGGLPPFIGFLPKWIVINSMINESSLMMLMILMFSSMVTLFFYLRMITPIIMTWNITNKWNTKTCEMKIVNMMMIIFNMSMPITIMLNFI